MAFLTDQILTPSVKLNDLIHIVNPDDISQNPDGSSYKATIQQVISGVTGNTLYEVGSGSDSTQRVGVSNDSSGDCSVISGGFNNTVITDYSSILGGCSNIIENTTSTILVHPNTIGGGSLNTIVGLSSTQEVYGNTIAGGLLNTIQSILSGGQTISGGLCNENLSDLSTINGGCKNTILGRNNFIGGGSYNTSNGTRSIITGGGGSCSALGNKTFCNYNFIGGGLQNVVNGEFSSILGGGSILSSNGNTINSCYSTIIGGCRNLISHDHSTIIGTNISTKSACTLHINNLLINNTPVQDQTATDYLVRDSISGMVNYKTIPGPTVYGLFSQTGNSVTISATTVESTIIDGGIGSLSVPANGFSVGDSFRADFGGLLSSKNADTIRVRIKAGSIVLGDSGPQTMSSATDDVWQLSINFTIRQIGTVGIASIVTLGVFHTTKQSNGAPEGFAFNTLNNTTFDTTISNTLDVTVEFSSNSPLNKIYSDIFVLNKIY